MLTIDEKTPEKKERGVKEKEIGKERECSQSRMFKRENIKERECM